MPTIWNAVPNQRISFIAPTSAAAGQKKGSMTVGTTNKSTFEGYFSSYDVLYFDDLNITVDVTIPSGKTIIVRNTFSLFHPCTINVGPNLTGGPKPGQDALVNHEPKPFVEELKRYDFKTASGQEIYYDNVNTIRVDGVDSNKRPIGARDDLIQSRMNGQLRANFDWRVHRKGGGGGGAQAGGDSSPSYFTGSGDAGGGGSTRSRWVPTSVYFYDDIGGQNGWFLTIEGMHLRARYDVWEDGQDSTLPTDYPATMGKIAGHYDNFSGPTSTPLDEELMKDSQGNKFKGLVNHALVKGNGNPGISASGQNLSNKNWQSRGISMTGATGYGGDTHDNLQVKKIAAEGAYNTTVTPATPLDGLLHGGSRGGAGQAWTGSGYIADTSYAYGGGCIKIMAKIMNVNGIIKAEGQKSRSDIVSSGFGNLQAGDKVSIGSQATTINGGRIAADSGAGSGGTVWLVAQSFGTLFNPTIMVQGGRGKFIEDPRSGYSGVKWGGGHGAGGFIRIDMGSWDNYWYVYYWNPTPDVTVPWGWGYEPALSIAQTIVSTNTAPNFTMTFSSTSTPNGISNISPNDPLKFGVDRSLSTSVTIIIMTIVNQYGSLNGGVAPTISIWKPDVDSSIQSTAVVNNAAMKLIDDALGKYQYSYNVDYAGNLAVNGTYQVKVIARDQDDNASEQWFLFAMDTQGPYPTKLFINNVETKSGFGKSGGSVPISVLVYDPTPTPSSTKTVSLRIDLSSATYTGSPLSDIAMTKDTSYDGGAAYSKWNGNIVLPANAAGTFGFYFVCTDNVNNILSSVATSLGDLKTLGTITIDNAAPTITYTLDPNRTFFLPGETCKIKLVVVESSGMASVPTLTLSKADNYSGDLPTITAFSLASQSGTTYNYTATITFGFSIGSVNAVINASDAAGNSVSSTVNNFVQILRPSGILLLS